MSRAAVRLITLGFAIAASVLTACSSVPDGTVAHDEAGLWMVMNRAEAEVKTSGRLVRDADLHAYILGIACRLDPIPCEGGIRGYVIRQPAFNAMMAPNGMMQVWTGLLLRTESEAQLAAVIGHEMAHHQERHTLQMLRNAKNALAAHMTLGVLTGGLSGLVTAPVIVGGLSGFSRSQEREADRRGLEMVAAAGYDPAEAAVVWENVVAEEEASDDDLPSLFFASHPRSKDRAAMLARYAEELKGASTVEYEVGTSRYAQHVGPLLLMLMEDELALRQPEKTELVLERLGRWAGRPGLVAFYRGEVFRLRGDEGDEENARKQYEASVEQEDAPAEAHRNLGLLLRRQGETKAAAAAFTAYLEASPDSSDRAMIESYLGEPR